MKAKKVAKKLRDRDISDANYAKFSRCTVVHDGQAVCFRYPCGDSYVVSSAKLLSWFREPNCVYEDGKAQDWPADRRYVVPADICIKTARRVVRGHSIRIRMSDDTAYDVAWDTVLMACEPLYEWYGGLPESKKAEC